jgi:pilus assembly protein TadC
MQMYKNSGWWSYFWSWLTGFLASLSAQDIIFGIGAVFTGIFTVLTYLSNDRKNKAIAAEFKRRSDMLKSYIKNRENINNADAPQVVQEMNDVLEKVEK